MNTLTKSFFITLMCCLICTPQACYSEKESNTYVRNLSPSPLETLIQTYAQELKKVIDANWQPPENLSSEDLKVLFTISKEGNLLKTKLLNPSKNKQLNDSAIEAVKKSFPFQPLPPNYAPNTLSIEYNFDYNVFRNEISESASLNTYLESLKKDLLLNWNVLGSNENLKTTVLFTINDKGNLLQQTLLVSSGSPEFDNMALIALKKAAPFYNIPLNYNTKNLNLKAIFHFDNRPKILLTPISELDVPRDFLPIANSNIKPDLNTSQNIHTIDPEKKGNYNTYKSLYKNWKGEIITPIATKLPLKLTNKNNKLIITIGNNSYQAENIQMNTQDGFKFFIYTGQKNNSQLLFEGKLRQNQLKGTTTDINGVEGYWYLNQA